MHGAHALRQVGVRRQQPRRLRAQGLERPSSFILARRDFGFETTLSGLGYRRLIRGLRSDGWRIELIYLALPSIELARRRVAERVRHGGHDIPLADIERRWLRSLDNFFDEYVHLVDRAVCLCNAEAVPVLVFTQRGTHREVADPETLRTLEERRDR